MRPFFLFLGCFFSCLVYAQRDLEIHLLLKDTKSKYALHVPDQCDSFKVSFNNEATKKRVGFLNKDFETRVFSKSISERYWFCNSIDSVGGKVHIEMVSLEFNNRDDLNRAIKIIESANRTNFKVKVLTSFKIRSSGRELLIVYSETVRNEIIAAFWEKI